MSSIKSYVVLALVAVLAAFAPAAARGDEGGRPDLSIGEVPACGDVTVASLSAADCGRTLDDSGTDEAGAFALVADVAEPVVAQPLALPAANAFDGPASASCRYRANAIFYMDSFPTINARTLANNSSPCVDYWIHTRTFDTNKLACRPNWAADIRSNGPRFHAMCEAHYAGWETWVKAAPGRTWYGAGVALRAQMKMAGFDVTKGDTWSVNELTSAVRTTAGSPRKNALEFLRGLYDGGPTEPNIQGNVFVVGLAQLTTPTTQYKTNLKNWFLDSAFWAEASQYVRFWGQEVYGDIRNTLVPGESRNRRAESLNDYLQQVGMLAEAGPDDVSVARSYLREAHYPLANAAWGWAPGGFGFTQVPAETMKQYLAIQEFALRHYLGANPHRVAPTVGYAWAPENRFMRLPVAQFRAQWMEMMQMLAISIAGTFGPGGSSQVGACGPPGEHLWCDGDYEGAVFNSEWQLLRSWD